MSRVTLDASTALSSTAANVRKFIKDTDISDSNRSNSTLPSSVHSNKDRQSQNIEKNTLPPKVEIDEDSSIKENASFEQDHLKSEVNDVKVPIEGEVDAFKNRLRYLPNSNFLYHNGSFSTTMMSPGGSIPNTFKYKSHPNAKTKSQIGMPSGEISRENPAVIEEDADSSSGTNHKSQILRLQDSNKSYKKVSKAGLNPTPEWMPKELTEEWVTPNSDQRPIDENELDFGSSVRITRKSGASDGRSQIPASSNGTMIHNSHPSYNATPMWKRASKEYELNKQSQVQLQNIFLSLDNSKDKSISHTSDKQDGFDINIDKNNDLEHNNNSASSTLSTPITSFNKDGATTNLTRNQISKLENILETEGKGKPNDYILHVSNPESPLKLFGDKYNTFTKGKLTDILKKINTKSSDSNIFFDNQDKYNKTNENILASRTNINEPDHHKETKTTEEPHEPRLRIKNFTKSGSYTEEQFLQNANNLFKNIQKRGFKSKQADEVPLDSVSHPHTNSTSTPKHMKTKDLDKSYEDYSSFTSDLDDDDSNFKVDSIQQGLTNNNEYTYENSFSSQHNWNSKNNELSPHNLRTLQKQLSLHDGSSYTFEDGYSTEEVALTDSSRLNHRRKGNESLEAVTARLDEIEKMIKDISTFGYKEKLESLVNENRKLKKQISQIKSSPNDELQFSIIDDKENISPERNNLIKWKRASQLRMQAQGNSKQGNEKKNHIIKGKVEPGISLPLKYDNMVFDEEKQRWVDNNANDNVIHGSLDSIEDLVTNPDSLPTSNLKTSYAKNSGVQEVDNKSKKSMNNKAEVSFNLPDLVSEDRSFEGKNDAANVTHISQLSDLTFTQTRKKLVAIITDALDNGINHYEDEWERIDELNIAGSEMDNVKDLNTFLPNLKVLDLSSNHIKFLDGIPEQILDLNLANNEIGDDTSFQKFRDLQHLNVSDNNLTNVSSLSYNIHLNELYLSNNLIVTINSLKSLCNLTKLDITQNKLSGDLNFKILGLKNLQELNVSENELQGILNIEYAPNLRVLIANDNRIHTVSCQQRHPYLKKLYLKFNNLKNLDISMFPHLRSLKIDGNELEDISEIGKLKYLEDISFLSQYDSNVANQIFLTSNDVLKMNMSGNFSMNLLHNQTSFKFLPLKSYFNLNSLVLSAMNLSKIPNNFSDIFPNVRELNLNFNKLNNIYALSGLKNLKKLYLVSNSIAKLEMVAKSLSGSRSSLKLLDLRLNPVSIEIYPYVFNPYELDYFRQHKWSSNGNIIQLETIDDIESFSIHYQSLLRGNNDWEERDMKFLEKLKEDSRNSSYNRRQNYEIFIIMFFNHLKKLDGNTISSSKRLELNQKLMARDIPVLQSP